MIALFAKRVEMILILLLTLGRCVCVCYSFYLLRTLYYKVYIINK